MKMQIWKIHISEGVMDAIHGGSHPIYEACVPELKLAINYLTSFVLDESDFIERYMRCSNDELTKSPPPKLICEVELSRAQIADMKQLASQDSPEDRIQQLIGDVLEEKNLSTDGYKDLDK